MRGLLVALLCATAQCVRIPPGFREQSAVFNPDNTVHLSSPASQHAIKAVAGAESVVRVEAPARSQPPISCGISTASGSDTRITGGQLTDKAEVPWQASIVFVNGGFVFCAGSIVSENIIVTAAHCLRVFRAERIEVLVSKQRGSRDPGEARLRVAEIIYHPDYIPYNSQNDIALIRLSGSLREVFNSGRAAPICLPERRCDVTDPASCLVGRRGLVSGFGLQTSEGKDFAGQLLSGKVPIMDNRQCARRFADVSPPVVITGAMLCAGRDLGGVDTCQGDSGGPLAVRGDDAAWRLQGIVSFGRGCGLSGYPGVYTRVSEFVDWIKNYL